MHHEENLASAVAAVHSGFGDEPLDLAIILGSGLGAAAEHVAVTGLWDYRDFDCFPRGAVAGHAGQLVAGTLHGRRVLLFQGRFHLYQGFSAWQSAMPVRLAHALGCRRLLLTNAVGGIHSDLQPGRFMFVQDHINLSGDNPLRGMPGDIFIDLCHLYRGDLYPDLHQQALARGMTLYQGVLAAVAGPSYETPAEVRALGRLGADAVSMSLVAEAIMAGYFGMELVGLSFVTNRAAGLAARTLRHDDVLAVGQTGVRQLAVLLELLCRLWWR
jgi:purine-nucleoside phosphorylase